MPTHANEDDIASLRRWVFDGEIPEATLSRLLADPRLPTAIRTLAVNGLEASANDKALDGICKDAGRYFTAMLVVYLHASGQLTLPNLKAYCATTKLLSPGRARALLSYLRYLKFIDQVPAELRKGPARYTATAALLTAWRSQLRAALQAACTIEPAVRIVLDRLDDPEVFFTFIRIQTNDMIAHVENDDAHREDPFMHTIIHRHAGARILLSLLTTAEFPPSEPIPLSISATAQRFGVSRIHVQRMLDEAQGEGLLRRTDRGEIVFAESAKTYMRFFYPMQMIRLFSAAAKTIAARPDIFQPAVVHVPQPRAAGMSAAHAIPGAP
jgi:AraC-like DNA-binding protein